MASIPTFIRIASFVLFIACVFISIRQSYHFEGSSWKKSEIISKLDRIWSTLFITLKVVFVISQICLLCLMIRFNQLQLRAFALLEVMFSTINKECSYQQLKVMHRNFYVKLVKLNLKLTVSLWIFFLIEIVTNTWLERELVYPLPNCKSVQIHYYPMRVLVCFLLTLYPISHCVIFTNKILSEIISAANTLEVKSKSKSKNDSQSRMLEMASESKTLQKTFLRYIIGHVAVAIALEFFAKFVVINLRPAKYGSFGLWIKNLEPATMVFLVISAMILYSYNASVSGQRQIRNHDFMLHL